MTDMPGKAAEDLEATLHAPAAFPGACDRMGFGRQEGAIALGLSAALVWLAQFHHFSDFGLYEDDYFFISEAMGKDWSYLAGRFHTAFTALPQGRPFGFFLPDLLSFVGDKLGGLAGIYLVGFVVVTLNTFLCYRLLRSRVPIAPAAVGAAVFCLFPADTTKIFLTHDFQLQPSLTFALLSALAYMATQPHGTSEGRDGRSLSLRPAVNLGKSMRPAMRSLWLPAEATLRESSQAEMRAVALRRGGGPARWWQWPACVSAGYGILTLRGARRQTAMLALSSLLSAGALLSYENGFLALVALPLFARRWDRRTPRQLVTHVLILASVVAIVVALRFVVGEGRATSSVGGVAAILPPLLGSLLLGPLRSLGGMVYGPFKAVTSWDLETMGAVVVALIGFAVILRWTQRDTRDAEHGTALQIGADHMAVLQVAAAGAVMLVVGYALAFTHFPPNALVGRGTSVHLGATLGMWVLAAGFAWLILSLRPRVATALLASYLASDIALIVRLPGGRRRPDRARNDQRTIFQTRAGS